jgi:hypothetical protein
MNFKKLPREPMRPESEPDYEKELWQPNWRCYCCQDTGIIRPRLATLVIEGYDPSKDKIPVCQNQGCSEVLGESINHCLDTRLKEDICQQLDQYERENWRKTLIYWQKQRQLIKEQQAKTIELSQKMSLRKQQRTPEEHQSAQRRHEEVRQLHN